MKNINKIMFACLMMTVGYVQAGDDTSADNSSTPAMGRPMVGTSSATYSPTINFTVYKNVPDYVAGMTGNYNPNTQIATINDANGVVHTFGNVTKFQPRTREHMSLKELEGKQLIGAISSTPNSSHKFGGIRSHAMMLDSLLFGELQS